MSSGPRRVLICGDRNWEEDFPIRTVVSSLPKGSTVIHGAARGADSMAGDIAEELGYEVEVYPAQWTKYGRGAGPIRNQQMLDEGRPDEVWAFHHSLADSKGTRDMVSRSRKARLPTYVVS